MPGTTLPFEESKCHQLIPGDVLETGLHLRRVGEKLGKLSRPGSQFSVKKFQRCPVAPIFLAFWPRDDHAAFKRVLEEAFRREPSRILGYCVMPDHWHLVVWPRDGKDRQVSEFRGWHTVTHTHRWHAHRHNTPTDP